MDDRADPQKREDEVKKSLDEGEKDWFESAPVTPYSIMSYDHFCRNRPPLGR